ncbi:adenosylcobinamide-GDP ribazoletransferase [Lysobacter sp. 5GHs7-4]|uniref:adenosylcobinamide-GDP ribazoletransferase n=1 Tax=Lysobacter sp. 5GHs7-4 TaxID=2904253 RepID=UPI001E2C4409|nr:adenosylcobinamide-GDP ribazoletransferase [Lysobacter sp. 5GHs7-4]UHQ25133.1 adenosylcobinamide-GDP ribazoletransferase [Lysobacter sp. 5GHs7-4]
MMRALLHAIGFLTRVPVPASAFGDARAQSRSLVWYPWVGALLGALLCALAWALQSAPPLLAAALLLLAWVLLTGALHLDGLADSADAWIGGMGATPEARRERTLDIMKDPRSGPAGVVALVLALLLKFAALASLPAPAWWALLLAPTLARATLTLAFLSTPYVRSGGLGSGLVAVPRAAAIASLLVAAAACALAGWRGGLAVVVALSLFALWRRACMRRLQGMTGDTCGALAEMVEAAVLVSLALSH